MSKTTLTRKELHELVWSEPLTSLSKKLDVPYDDLRKVCSRMNISLPKSGHWMKAKVGKQVAKPELSDDYQGKTEVSFPLEDEMVLSPETILIRKIESAHGSLLKVPTKLTNPDKLIVATEKSLKDQKYYRFGRDAGLGYSGLGTLHMHLSKESVDRALRFYDALIKLLKARGHRIIAEERETFIVVGEEPISVRLQEKSRRVTVPGKSEINYEPTGLLYFKIDTLYGSVCGEDRKPLGEQLAKIIARLEICAEGEKQRRLRRMKEEQERADEENRAWELYRAKEKELGAFNALLQKAKRYSETVMLRNYITEAEKFAFKKKVHKELEDWFAWARKKTDWYDPFIEAEDELLDGIDRNRLVIESKPSRRW